jgi:hypothetical protein
LVSSTIQVASLFASGQAAAPGVISAHAIALTEGVLKTMFLTKSKIAAAILLIAVSLTGSAGLLYQTPAAQNFAGPEQPGLPGRRADEFAGEQAEKSPELQRRIEKLEKQIQTLTNEVKALQKKVDAPTARPPAKAEVKVYQLHNSNVDDVAEMLWFMHRNKAGSEFRVGKDHATNALIVVASPNELALIETIITQLSKLPKKQKEPNKVVGE